MLTFKKSVLCVAIGLAMSTASTVIAAEDETAEIERIEVTGSRIARAEVSQPNPVVSIDASDIQKFGTPDLGSMLAELPAIGATDTLMGNNDANEVAGLSSADLRRLGAERTLVLVNGKRHVAGAAGSAQVDLSTIPTSLIDRVEILTGGASAVYGSDAVSGVVNVILKDDFEGLEFNFTGGKSTEGIDDQYHTLSLLGGGDIGNKGNATFFAGYERIKEVLATDVNRFDDWGTVENPLDGGEDDGIADRIRVPRVYSEYIDENGVFFDFANPIFVFDNDGNLLPQTLRENSNSFAFGNFPDGCEYCFKLNDYENVYPGIEKINVGSTFNYEMTDWMEFYGEVKYVTIDVSQQFQPAFRFFDNTINVAENPFLDDTTRQTLLDAGYTNALFNKFYGELGNRSAQNERDTFRWVGGFRGDYTLSETDFTYDLYYVWGETNTRRRTLNDLIEGNLAAALDAVIDPDTGEIACRSQVPSAQGDGYEDPAAINGDQCVAYNPFGFGLASDEAKAFVSAPTTRSDEITQEVIGGFMAFDSAELFELPGGPVDVVLGFEYRWETSETITDELTKQNVLTTAATPDESGKYDVDEWFIEMNLPIMNGRTGVEELNLGAAFRTADYSHAGSADAWKVDLLYAPIDSLRLRGTISEAVRAPNINEAFSALSPGFARVSDPCDVDNLDDDPDRAANCAALGAPPGFEANDNVSVDTLSGGNPDLDSEEADTVTYGIAWEPTFLDGLSITMDWYDIEIDDAIRLTLSQDIVDNCVDAAGGPDFAFCDEVDRNPDTFDIELVRSGFRNVAALNTQGLETQIFYDTDLAMFDLPGEVRLSLLVNYLDELEIFEFQNRPDEINREDGEIGDPEWQGRLGIVYRYEEMDFSWNTRWVDRSAAYALGEDTSEDVSPAYVPSIVTHDFAWSWNATDNLRVNAGLRNVFDKTPPDWITGSGSTEAIYDVIGRRWYAGVNFRF